MVQYKSGWWRKKVDEDPFTFDPLDDMCKVALGVLGVPLSDFKTWTVYQYKLAVDGHKAKQNETWAMVKTQAYYSLIAMQGSKNIKWEDIALPIDKPKEKKRVKWRKITMQE